jgi:DNA primase
MNGTFDDTAKEEVRLRADIAAVVGRYVKLKPNGATLKGLCPFHKEKTPSFHVNPQRGFFHCFGCGKGGDVFKFLQEIESLTFPEALKMLADETGVTIVSRRQETPSENIGGPQLSRTAMIDIHKAAGDFFYGQIRNNPAAVDYLKSRGLAAETVRDFRLGFAPSGWSSLLQYAEKKGIPADSLVACGLAIKKEDGSCYDRFRDRIIFSLFDLSGRIIGFAGRGMTKDATPKYLNSPETPIYRKKEFLYGLNITRQYIKEEKFVLVVEGYMDFLTLYQSGVRNVVATSGTAMTPEHGHLLKRFTSRVVLVFDGDAAGQKAAERGVFTLSPFDLDVSVLVLPAEEDPDSFVKAHGPEPFRAMIAAARNANDFIIDKMIAEHGGTTPRGQKAVIEHLAPLLSSISDAIAKDRFRKDLAEKLGLDEQMVLKVLRGITGGPLNKTASSEVSAGDDEVYLRSLEGSFLHMLLSKPEFVAEARQYVAPETLTDAVSSDIYSLLLQLYDEQGTLADIIDHAASGEIQRLISRMLVKPARDEHIHEELVQKIIHLRAKFLRSKLREIKILLKQEGAQRTALLEQLRDYSNQLRDLNESE